MSRQVCSPHTIHDPSQQAAELQIRKRQIGGDLSNIRSEFLARLRPYHKNGQISPDPPFEKLCSTPLCALGCPTSSRKKYHLHASSCVNLTSFTRYYTLPSILFNRNKQSCLKHYCYLYPILFCQQPPYPY